MSSGDWIKGITIVGGVAGAVGTVIASGGGLLPAILAGVAALGTGVGAWHVKQPSWMTPKPDARGQVADAENPKP